MGKVSSLSIPSFSVVFLLLELNGFNTLTGMVSRNRVHTFFSFLDLNHKIAFLDFAAHCFRDLLDNFSLKEARAHTINQSTTSSKK